MNILKKFKSFFQKDLTTETQGDKVTLQIESTNGDNPMNKVLNAIVENGKFCKVEFLKKDGSVGTVHGRTGVKRYAKGGKRTTNDRDYIMFYDLNKGYRNVNRHTILKVNGVNLKIKLKEQ